MKKVINSELKKRLLSNFFSLSVIQVANYILPLFTIPYLVRILGVEDYGILIFSFAIVNYFVIITDYGFNLSATREISINKNNKAKIMEIFNSVIIIKTMLMFICFILLCILVFTLEKFSNNWLIYLLSFGMVLGQVLFPSWFFQGMERMKYITYLTVLSRLFYTIAIFLFVREANDLYLVPFFNSLGLIIVGIISLFFIKKEFQMDFKLQKINILKQYIIDGWHIFLSQLSVSLFSNTNIIILGFFANDLAVGYYSLSEKIVSILSRIQIPITESIFPHIAYLIKVNKKQAITQLKKIIKIGSVCYLFILSFIAIFSSDIILILFGKEAIESKIILQIIIIIPLAIFLNNIFGTQIMLNTGKTKVFLRILLEGAIINVILSSFLSYYFSYIGTAISILFVELFIMIRMFFNVKKEFL